MRTRLGTGDNPDTIAARHTPDVPASSYRERAIADYLRSLNGTDGLTVECDPRADTAYIQQDDYEEAPAITIPGRELPVHTHDFDSSIGTRLVQYGLALHEHGHDRYTPGPLLKELFDRQTFDIPLESFYWGLVNFFEDARIESGLIAEEGDWAQQRLIFTHLNFTFAQPEEIRNPEAITWQTGLKAAAAHFGKGQEKGHIIPILEDSDDNTLQWRSDKDKRLYYWVLPAIKSTLEDVTSEPDGEAAANRMLRFLQKLDATLSSLADDPPEDDQRQRDSASNGTDDRHNDMGSEKEQPSSLDNSDGGKSKEGKSGSGESDDDTPEDGDTTPSTSGGSGNGDASDDNEDAQTDCDSDESTGDSSDASGGNREGDSVESSNGVGGFSEQSDDEKHGGEHNDSQGSEESDKGTETDSSSSGQNGESSQPEKEGSGSSESDKQESESPADTGDGEESTGESGEQSESNTSEKDSSGNGGGGGLEGPDTGGEQSPESGEEQSGSSNAEDAGQPISDEPSPSAEADGQSSSGDGDATDHAQHDEMETAADSANGPGSDDDDNADSLSKALINRETRKSKREERKVERDKEDLAEEIERLQTALGAGGGNISHLSIAESSEHTGSADVWDKIQSEASMLKGPLQSVLQQSEQTEFQRGTKTGRFDPALSRRLAVNNLSVNQVDISGDEKQYSVIVVLDRSGSMSGDITEAEVAAAGFALALEKLGIDVAIVDLYRSEARMVKPFPAKTRTKRDILTSGAVGGGTPLTDALVVSRERVRQEPYFPFMFVVSDGQPSEPDRYLDELEATDFPVLGVTLGAGTASDLDDYYDVARTTTPDNVGDELVSLATEIMF